MDTRIAMISIIIGENEAVPEINRILHEFSQYIIGRMGIPYKERGINLISIAVDAENNIISSLSGKLGMVSGASVKTMYSPHNKV